MNKFENIKVIFSDMDGTLLDNNKKVLNSSVEAIKKLKSQNYLFGICTGREAQTVEILLKEWNLLQYVDFVIGTGGVQIFDYINKTKKEMDLLDGNVILEIANYYDDFNCNIGVPYNGKLYFPKENKFVKDLSIHDSMPTEIVDFNEFLKEPKGKAMIMCGNEDVENFLIKSKSFKSKYGYERLPIKTGHRLFEYMNPNVNKARSIAFALKEHNLTLENVLAFGDADNDYEMIKDAKVGVAMENGSEKTRSVADYITDNNNNDGISNFLNKYVF